VSYPWEVSVANPLPGPFASIGMSPTDVVEEPDQDSAPSEGPARSDPEDGPGTHYIDPSFRNELQKVINFEVKYSFRRNYRVIAPSPTDTVNNPPPGCVAVYLEALELGLRFPLPKIVMDILRTYEVAIAQLVPNAWASILSFAATCKLKTLRVHGACFHLYPYHSVEQQDLWGKRVVPDHRAPWIPFCTRQTYVHPRMEVSVRLCEEGKLEMVHPDLEYAGAEQNLEQAPHHS